MENHKVNIFYRTLIVRPSSVYCAYSNRMQALTVCNAQLAPLLAAENKDLQSYGYRAPRLKGSCHESKQSKL